MEAVDRICIGYNKVVHGGMPNASLTQIISTHSRAITAMRSIPRQFIERLIVSVALLVLPAGGIASAVAQQSTQSDPPAQQPYLGVSKVKVFDYEGCIELKNETTRVVLGHHRGGRVLKYELNGRDALYLADESGWKAHLAGLKSQLTAGRFDLGPEHLQVRGNTIWQDAWTVAPTGDRQATMTSQVDPASGLQVTRTFRLAGESSRLTVTQTVFNRGKQRVRQCYWSRTFANHGGTAIIPCAPSKTRLPKMYYLAPNLKSINIYPEEEAVRREGDFLIVDRPPSTPKMGFDAVKGWVAYQTRDDLLFVKRFEVSETRNYGEPTGINLSIWYPPKAMIPCCEVEPIGPMQDLAPGEQASYSVDWWLLNSAWPGEGKVDPVEVETMVQKQCLR